MGRLVQRGYRVSGNIQNQAGQSPEQPAPGDLALSRAVGLDDVQRSIPSTAIPWPHSAANNLLALPGTGALSQSLCTFLGEAEISGGAHPSREITGSTAK